MLEQVKITTMEEREPNMESKEKLRDATLVFLIKRSQGKISEICLAMKKRGFGMNRWNGVGGKVEKDENIFITCGQMINFGFPKC